MCQEMRTQAPGLCPIRARKAPGISEANSSSSQRPGSELKHIYSPTDAAGNPRLSAVCPRGSLLIRIYAVRLTAVAPDLLTSSFTMLSNFLFAAILTAFALVCLYSRLKSYVKTSAQASDEWCSADGEEKIPVPGSSMPDPDPLSNFDLEMATARNFIYANKTLRYPYHQVSGAFYVTFRCITE